VPDRRHGLQSCSYCDGKANEPQVPLWDQTQGHTANRFPAATSDGTQRRAPARVNSSYLPDFVPPVEIPRQRLVAC
jgi:hypothetical protein